MTRILGGGWMEMTRWRVDHIPCLLEKEKEEKEGRGGKGGDGGGGVSIEEKEWVGMRGGG